MTQPKLFPISNPSSSKSYALVSYGFGLNVAVNLLLTLPKVIVTACVE